MNVASAALLSVLLLGAPATPAGAAGTIQRFVLVIGANAGGGDRPKLQYAISDAERFARVMVELGGVPQANEVVLRQPKLKDLVDALEALSARAKEAQRGKDAGRVEVIVYYSGHADEQGLLLGGDRYSYRTLRDRLDAIPADVRIAVLDACASGAFTRLKGGKVRPPFLVDESADMRGHAFLTSSAETEAAQESDRIRASYFTHYLVSGFRGAADLSGDGKITLNEAYQFAFNETLGRTVDTRGGAQHPSYDINLSGSGDVVMTDVRQTTATLVLGEDLDGRFFIRNAAQELVVELYKPFGRKVELGLEPGAYEVRLDRAKTSLLAKTRIDDGAKLTLDAKQFGPVAVEATRKRGGDPIERLAVEGRNRLALRLGARYSQAHVLATGGDRAGLSSGFQYTRYVTEHLGVTIGVGGMGGRTVASATNVGLYTSAFSVASVPIGVQWNPLRRNPSSPIKPFIAATAGPVIGSSAGSFVAPITAGALPTVVSPAATEVTAGGHVGGGIDFHVSRPFAIGIVGGYNWMAPFSRPIAGRDNYSGGEFAISLEFFFGKGR
jgi:hypothetical protein